MIKMDNIFNYVGQERGARRLLISEKLEKVEDVAVMTADEVSEKIREHYEVIFKSGEEILVIRKTDMDTFKSITKTLHR